MGQSFFFLIKSDVFFLVNLCWHCTGHGPAARLTGDAWNSALGSTA